MDKLKIMIVDDHPIIEQGLLAFLEEYGDLEVVGTARDGLEGLEKVRALQPDIIVQDLVMPKIDGIEAIRLFRAEQPEAGILVYSGHKNEMYLRQALDAGARGYVLKGGAISQLVEAIREVHLGGVWISPEFNRGSLRNHRTDPEICPASLAVFESLSPREKQVFQLLAKGKATDQIADVLSISPKTVAKHRVSIKRKLKVKNLAEMANYAARLGLSRQIELAVSQSVE